MAKKEVDQIKIFTSFYSEKVEDVDEAVGELTNLWLREHPAVKVVSIQFQEMSPTEVLGMLGVQRCSVLLHYRTPLDSEDPK